MQQSGNSDCLWGELGVGNKVEKVSFYDTSCLLNSEPGASSIYSKDVF